jgi:hypothetical protein
LDHHIGQEDVKSLSLVLCGCLSHFSGSQSEGSVMRYIAILALSAAVLTPVPASADPRQLETAPAADAQAATPGAPQAPGNVAPGTPAAGERVIVHPPAVSDNLDQIVCKTSPPQTGSRLGGSRECHTAREWKVRQQQSQDMLAHSQSLGMQQPLRN